MRKTKLGSPRAVPVRRDVLERTPVRASASSDGPLLVAVDGSRASMAALRIAAALAKRDDRWIDAVVFDGFARPGGTARFSADALRHEVLAPASRRERVRRQLCSILESDSWSLHVGVGSFGPTVARVAERLGTSLIILGVNHHRSALHSFGSAALARLWKAVEVPVLAVPATARELPRIAVAAVDFSPASRRAAHAARGILVAGGALHLVHVRPPDLENLTDIEGWNAIYHAGAMRGLEELAAQLHTEGLTIVPRVVSGPLRETLLAVVRETHADLLACGATSASAVERWFVGHLSLQLIRDAECSLLAAPRATTLDRASPAEETTVTTTGDGGASADTADVRAPDETALAPADRPCVLVATNGSDEANAALRFASALAVRDGLQVRVLAVVESLLEVPTPPFGGASPATIERAGAERILDDARHALTLAGADGSASTAMLTGNPGTTIPVAAREWNSAYIILGTRRHSTIERVFTGDMVARVMRHANVPTIAIPASGGALPKSAVAAVDFGETSLAAARSAAALVLDGVLHLLHIRPELDTPMTDPSAWSEVYESGARSLMNRLRADLEASHPELRVDHTILRGFVPRVLLDFALRVHADLVSVGQHGHGPVDRLVFGSVASVMVHAAPCAILVAPAHRK